MRYGAEIPAYRLAFGDVTADDRRLGGDRRRSVSSRDSWDDAEVARHPLSGGETSGIIPLIAFCLATSLLVALMPAASDRPDWGMFAFAWGPWLPATWVFVVRPRLVMLDEELVVVGVFTTRRYPLRDIVGADPTGFGTYFSLADGDTFCASTIARPNYAAWLGRRTRAHKVATRIVVRAAELRGDPVPDPVGQPREF